MEPICYFGMFVVAVIAVVIVLVIHYCHMSPDHTKYIKKMEEYREKSRRRNK